MTAGRENSDEPRIQAAREALPRALGITAGHLAAQTVEALRAVLGERGETWTTPAEGLVSPAGQVVGRAYERLLTIIERAESLGIDIDQAIRDGVLARCMEDADIGSEVAVRLAHYEPQFGVA